MQAPVVQVYEVVVAVLLAATFAVAADERSVPTLHLPPDVTYGGAETSPGPVVFSHATHVPLADDRCVACHPALFSILQPTRGIRHDEMNLGKQCGACHDGTKASGVQDACDHCHRMGGGP
jgi:c(7)-type cytochrome triheme protein